MRTLVDIPDGDIDKLDALAKRKGISRAAEIRDAIKRHLVHHADNHDWIQRGRGFWKGREDIGDGLEYQFAIRKDRTTVDDL